MYDLHCHFLPGIDDGAKDISEALAMSRHAVSSGITHSILTPHIQHGRYDNDLFSIERSFKAFQQALIEHEIQLHIGFAAEVRITHDIIELIEQGKIPFLGNNSSKNFILLELPHSHIPAGTDNMIKWLSSKNIIPIIPHPERNKEIMREPKKVIPLYNQGCQFQLTAGAVAGQFGKACFNAAQYLLQGGFVFLLATDAHNLKHRPPELEPGRQSAEKIVGESASWDLVLTNPQAITGMHFLK